MPKLRHSALYMPADRPALFEKVEHIAADMVIFDLEDAVAPQAKDQARENVRDYFALKPKSAKERLIRINGLESAHFTEDLLAARKCLPDGILLPKINSAKQAQSIRTSLAETDAPPALALWAMVETAEAIMNIRELADHATSGLAGLILGSNDLTLETGLHQGPNRLYHLPLLVQILMAAKAGGTFVLDGVYNNFSHLEGLTHEAIQAQNLGFDGKTAIHPSQIGAINAAFTPKQADIERALAIKVAFEAPENAHKGAIQLSGAMVERLHLNQSLALLALANAIEERQKS